MAAPTLYRSSDASAPVLTGTSTDLVNLLDKCLVTGYGAQTNAGWTRNTGFAGNSTSRAVFRQGAGNQFYLDVDDRGATSVLTGASGKEAAIRGYETMTDVSTGTNPFPTTALIAAATANWRKSATADTVPRGWFLIADDRSFILGILDGDVANQYKLYYFGDFYSLKSADGYRTCITIRTTVNGTGIGGSFLGQGTSQNVGAAVGGLYAARNNAATVGAINESQIRFGTTDSAQAAFPPPDNNVYLSKIYIGDAATAILRGYFRGVYQIVTPLNLNDGDTFTGTGDFAGRSFVLATGFNGSSSYAIALETTVWDTSS